MKIDRDYWDPDEIRLDLNKLSEYMKNLQPGQYADIDEIVRQCAVNDEDSESLLSIVRRMSPGERRIIGDYEIFFYGDGVDVIKLELEGEDQ